MKNQVTENKEFKNILEHPNPPPNFLKSVIHAVIRDVGANLVFARKKYRNDEKRGEYKII